MCQTPTSLRGPLLGVTKTNTKEDMGIVYEYGGTLQMVPETCCSQMSGPKDSPAIEETKTSCYDYIIIE